LAALARAVLDVAPQGAMAMRPKLGAVDTCAGAPAKSPATTDDTTAKFVATPYFSGPDDLPRRPHQRADRLTPPRAVTPKLAARDLDGKSASTTGPDRQAILRPRKPVSCGRGRERLRSGRKTMSHL